MTSQEIVLVGFYLIVLLYTVILHEVAHGVVALWLGDKTAQYAGRLTLNPVSHIDVMGSKMCIRDRYGNRALYGGR